MSVWYEMEELVPIVGRLARKYTSGDSTSISYEKAEQLMGAVLYCIREAGAQRKWAVADRENLTAETAYLTGAACVEKKTKRALRLYHQILKNFDSYEQHCLNETITKGMPEYFRWYDPIFAPQETLLTLDYPVLEDLKDYTGIDCVERWLSRVKQEQQFLHCFPRADLIWMLEEYDEDYRDGMDNLCEMVLSVCVKQTGYLAGKRKIGFGKRLSREELGFWMKRFIRFCESFCRKQGGMQMLCGFICFRPSILLLYGYNTPLVIKDRRQMIG